MAFINPLMKAKYVSMPCGDGENVDEESRSRVPIQDAHRDTLQQRGCGDRSGYFAKKNTPVRCRRRPTLRSERNEHRAGTTLEGRTKLEDDRAQSRHGDGGMTYASMMAGRDCSWRQRLR